MTQTTAEKTEHKRIYTAKQRLRIAAYQKVYRAAHKKEFQAYKRKHRVRARRQMLVWRAKHKLRVQLMQKRHRAKLRLEILEHYGNVCACCGEWHTEFLEVDHIKNDGNLHRKEIGRGSMYNWLRQHHYPKGFQMLCSNCNKAKANYHVCPHKIKKAQFEFSI